MTESKRVFNKVNKLGNAYFDAAGRDTFERIPKAVWAAIAISLATCGGDNLDQARALILKEWLILHQNGIVPQAPPPEARTLSDGDED